MASLGCARIGDKCGGVYITTQSVNLYVDGKPAGSLGSIVSGHGDPPHVPNPIVTSSQTVFSGGIPLARLTDTASCGHKTSTASTSVRIG